MHQKLWKKKNMSLLIKFISDENIPAKLTELLKEKDFDIKKISLGATDKEISKISKEESRIILTFDRHFINRRLFNPKEYPRIIFIQIHPPLIDIIFSSLTKLFGVVENFKGKLFILSEQGFRIKE